MRGGCISYDRGIRAIDRADIKRPDVASKVLARHEVTPLGS